ncbi:MAG: GtrA family protein [Elusimicrobiales bacterium]|nr:GtrA family protein [Elusimicrobiales bacterium]
MERILEHYRRNRPQADRLGRFIVTGVWNTIFGIFVYAALYEWLKDSVHYLLLLIPGNILAITNAFVCHKLFVFRTRGNVLREYLRFYVVYGGAALLGFVLMFVLVDGFGAGPVAAQVLSVPITIALSYFSHLNYSFKVPKDRAGAAR